MISASKGFINQSEKYSTDNAGTSKSKYIHLKKGELAYNHGNSKVKKYGAVFMLEQDNALVPFVYHCFSINKNQNSKYWAYYLNTVRHDRYLRKIVCSTARLDGLLNISSEDYFKMPVNYPELDEQNKVTRFLDLLYRKIELIEAKINTLKKYKKGIIKNLLKKSIFTDFLRLSDVCKIDTGKLDANQMVTEGKYKFFTCSREDFYIDSYAFDCEAILISGNGDVGFSKYYKGKFNAYQRTYVLHDFLINAKYIKIIFDENVSKIIKKETNIGAMPYIRKSTFDKVLIPKIKKESIEYFVSIYDSIEYKINSFESKLNSIKCFRNQLLKDMFI